MTETKKQQQDIDHLYNQLEATMMKVKNSNELKHSISSLSLSSNSSSSSSDSSDSSDEQLEVATSTAAIQHYCPCKQMLVSIDSQHCGLCDQVIPIIQQQKQFQKEIENIKTKLEEKQLLYSTFKNNINILKNEYLKCQESSIEMTSKIQSLNQDIQIVQLKHKDEIAHTIEIEHSKKLVENELHDLTQKLFEEANNMVLFEKKEKLAIQLQHDYVHEELKQTELQLFSVQKELNHVRNKMTEKDVDSKQQQQLQPSLFITATHENYLLRAQLDMSNLLNQSQPIEINQDQHMHDNSLIAEFQQFHHSIQSISISKLFTLPFMKSCMKSDIEPCTRFGSNPKITSKKITDAILVKTCLVEPCPPGFIEASTIEPVKSLWDRFSPLSNDTGFLGCQACGRTIGINEEDCWRFRISYFDAWSLIDRNCYDRIVSVIEFYAFLRKLRVGGYKDKDMFSVYQECSRLLLQMFLSRMGALPTLLDEFGLDSTRRSVSSPIL